MSAMLRIAPYIAASLMLSQLMYLPAIYGKETHLIRRCSVNLDNYLNEYCSEVTCNHAKPKHSIDYVSRCCTHGCSRHQYTLLCCVKRNTTETS
uniref:IlGF domain-containing protein n=2 Tax=Panagrellus redivivus TaxID=6233 RepID=A0A7E4VUT8_PANRE